MIVRNVKDVIGTADEVRDTWEPTAAGMGFS